MPAIAHISADALIDRYAVLLLDAYGVLVSLGGALPGAAEFIASLNRRGKPYWVVSNTAARLPEHAAERYRAFGLEIPARCFLTSGMLLGAYFRDHDLLGRRTLVLGPEDSHALVAMAGGRPVSLGEDFEVLVLADQAGFPFLETVDRVLSALLAKLDAGLTVPMILPNPDLIYPTGAGYGITAGSIALILEAALEQRYPECDGLRFVRLGKPHPAIFAEALRLSGTRDMVMVGDQLETDIRGANDFGLDSVLVLGGVSRRLTGTEGHGPRPSFLLESLALG